MESKQNLKVLGELVPPPAKMRGVVEEVGTVCRYLTYQGVPVGSALVWFLGGHEALATVMTHPCLGQQFSREFPPPPPPPPIPFFFNKP